MIIMMTAGDANKPAASSLRRLVASQCFLLHLRLFFAV